MIIKEQAMSVLNYITNSISNIVMGTDITKCIKTETEDIYVVFIINDKYTRWDIFTSIDTIQDMHDVLKTKYHIDKSVIKINDNYYYDTREKLINLATDSSITVKITTKNNTKYK